MSRAVNGLHYVAAAGLHISREASGCLVMGLTIVARLTLIDVEGWHKVRMATPVDCEDQRDPEFCHMGRGTTHTTGKGERVGMCAGAAPRGLKTLATACLQQMDHMKGEGAFADDVERVVLKHGDGRG